MHISAIGLTMRVAYSLFTQSKVAKEPAAEILRRINELTLPDDKEEMETILLELLGMLDNEARSKTGSCKNVIYANMKVFIDKTLRGVHDASILLRAVKIVSNCCADTVCKGEFARLGGVRVLVTLLQNAHEASNLSLMEEIAATLQECTYVPIELIILPSDVPAEAKGAAALAKVSSLRSMLRTLDLNARSNFLNSMVTIFGSVCALRQGALIVGQGLDGKKGIEFFIPLLEHPHAPLVAAATRVIQSMIRHDMYTCREIFERGEVTGKLIDLLGDQRDPSIVLATLRIISVFINEQKLLREFILRDGLDGLFTVWCTGNDAILRDSAEQCILEIEADKTWKGAVERAREVYRTLIQRRAENDDKEKKQQMQQMQQQRMFQQMMMEQLGISPEMMEE